jgi:hypothetical protein
MKLGLFAGLAGAVCMLLGLSYASPAAAQATRTWVSGVGDDANPCSRTAPCKTFAGAISKTAAGGEINCLDPGGFGGVTITKSLSIVCDYTEGGILSAGAGVNGIVVNAGANDTIFLSGIDFNGAGNAQNGLRIVSGSTVHLRNSIIRNYRASNGLGISMQPSGAARLYVTDTTISDNGTGATGGGILIQATGSGSSRVHLRNVVIENNSNNAIRMDTTGNNDFVNGTAVVIEDSYIAGSTNGLNVIVPAATSVMNVLVENSVVVANSGTGIAASGSANATVRVGNTSISLNGTGVSATGGANINSFGTNRVFNNTTNGAFTGAIINPS